MASVTYLFVLLAFLVAYYLAVYCHLAKTTKYASSDRTGSDTKSEEDVEAFKDSLETLQLQLTKAEKELARTNEEKVKDVKELESEISWLRDRISVRYEMEEKLHLAKERAKQDLSFREMTWEKKKVVDELLAERQNLAERLRQAEEKEKRLLIELNLAERQVLKYKIILCFAIIILFGLYMAFNYTLKLQAAEKQWETADMDRRYKNAIAEMKSTLHIKVLSFKSEHQEKIEEEKRAKENQKWERKIAREAETAMNSLKYHKVLMELEVEKKTRERAEQDYFELKKQVAAIKEEMDAVAQEWRERVERQRKEQEIRENGWMDKLEPQRKIVEDHERKRQKADDDQRRVQEEKKRKAREEDERQLAEKREMERNLKILEALDKMRQDKENEEKKKKKGWFF